MLAEGIADLLEGDTASTKIPATGKQLRLYARGIDDQLGRARVKKTKLFNTMHGISRRVF